MNGTERITHSINLPTWYISLAMSSLGSCVTGEGGGGGGTDDSLQLASSRLPDVAVHLE